jgi:hypothetical protein
VLRAVKPPDAQKPGEITESLYGPHIGAAVVMAFEGADQTQPIVMGAIRQAYGLPLAQAAVQVEVDVDGEPMIVSATHQLVLRCGKARITLTKDGAILIDAVTSRVFPVG